MQVTAFSPEVGDQEIFQIAYIGRQIGQCRAADRPGRIGDDATLCPLRANSIRSLTRPPTTPLPISRRCLSALAIMQQQPRALRAAEREHIFTDRTSCPRGRFNRRVETP